MRRSLEIAGVFLVVLVVLVPVQRDALVDDFEDDFWLPFTHFHLGDRATAGYSATLPHSGLRSYRVEIHGWTLRDFGSAYGYAIFSTRGAALGELRVALLYESLQDIAASPWDAFAAGISLELLDARHVTLGTYRYVTAYRASQNAGRCAPTLSDVVLDDQPPLAEWIEVGRNPGADFPAAPWRSATYVKVAVGFLCAAGLTGATYTLFFDDFVLEAGSGDRDADGLRDLEEETRIHSIQLSEPDVPVFLAAPGETNVSLVGPPVAGILASGAVAIDLVHPRPDDLSVSLVVRNETREESHLLWDPGAYERGVAVTSPVPGQNVRGNVTVTGRVSPLAADGWVRLRVNGAPRPLVPLGASGTFSINWPTDARAEGAVSLQVEALEPSLDGQVGAVSEPLSVVIDRTAPDLRIQSPTSGASVSGLLEVSAGAYDGQGVASVELWLDGTRVDARDREPFVFLYETADLTNAVHRIEIRAKDGAGNVASEAISVSVSNRAQTPPPTCQPACNLTGGTSAGNLAPVRADARSWWIRIASGDRLEIAEGRQIPWKPQVVRTADGVSLILDVLGGTGSPLNGLVASNLTADGFARSGQWRIVLRDHGSGLAGFVQRASVRFATRTSPDVADTDGDGLSDGQELALPRMSPVLADLDGDGLSDGWESVPHSLVYTVDGEVRERSVRTDPLNPDSDLDGLEDGDEIDPPLGWNVTNPVEADTDGDGLNDGPERYEHGSDPTRTDTDGDTLLDGFEAAAHVLSLVIDGRPEERSVVTSPVLRDTDADGLTDPEEWDGADLWGFATDPSDPDTDHDGLNDGDEIRGTNRRPTNPLLSDSDSDGLVDGIDLAPTETWSLPWAPSYEPGLVRFQQRFHALDLHGIYAQIWTYDPDGGDCVYLSDHTATATKSSNESTANVGDWINKTFLQGGESNYTAVRITYAGLASYAWSAYERGGCVYNSARQYRIGYLIHEHLYDVDFVNVAPVRVTDEDGVPYDHATLEIPLVAGMAQSLLLQIVVPATADRGARTDGGAMTVPALQYSLHRSRDFLSTQPLYENLALGSGIDEHSYQFTLRIPAEVTKPGNAILRDGKVYAVLVVTPSWITTRAGAVTKRAWSASTLAIGAAVSKVETSAEHIVARLALNLTDLSESLPDSAVDLAQGMHTFGPYSVYVHHVNGTFDATTAETADAVWLSGASEEEVASFQSQLSWAPPEAWTRAGRDGFGTTVGIMKLLRRGISMTSQLTPYLVPTAAALPPWAWTRLTSTRTYVVAVTIGDAVEWNPIFLVSTSGTNTVNVQTFDPGIQYPITESYNFEWELGNAEILDDIDDSVILASPKNFNLRGAFRSAAIGTTLVIFGSQAILAWLDGDTVKATVFCAAGAVGILGIVKANVDLAKRAFPGGLFGKGVSLKLGPAAAIAVGGILSAYEISLGLGATDPIERLSHYEIASASMVDTLIGVIPLYGAPISLGWQMGLGILVGVHMLAGIVPDTLAVRIVSSPGSTAVFLFEYTLGNEIPSSIAQDALNTVLNALSESVRLCNCLNPPLPTVLVAPA